MGRVVSAEANQLQKLLHGFRRDWRLRVWAFKLAYHAASRFRRDRELSWDEIVEILSTD